MASDYSKLVEALRCSLPNPPETCEGCAYNTGGECNVARMMVDAADAIVALGLDNEDYEHENRRLHGEIEALQAQMPKRGEIVRCRECKWYSIYEAKKDGTPDKRYSPSVCLREIYAKRRDPDWFCADGEREVQE